MRAVRRAGLWALVLSALVLLWIVASVWGIWHPDKGPFEEPWSHE